MITWKEHKAYMLEKWTEFYFYWRYAPLWKWIAQLAGLGLLGFLLVFSSNMLIAWADSADVTPINEMLFMLFVVIIPISIIICMRCFALTIVYIARILDLEDNDS